MPISESKAYKLLRDPFVFIEKAWGLIPQKILPEYGEDFYRARRTGDYSSLRLRMFEPYVRGKHITWQQVEIIRAVQLAMHGIKARKISVRSGHGIGKSTCISWILLWFLFCFPESKIPCTAPTQNQMYDVLWAEAKKWIDRMPPFMADYYDYSVDYIRVNEAPENWFARARTARKEAPEALAGLHADHMLLIVDEASGVPEEIFNSAESALTNVNTLFIMISNPTRLIGYFFDSHNRLKKNFQTMNFSSEQSPEVNRSFVQSIIEKHGIDSDEYNIRVLGEFPKSETVDEKGYMPLINFPISVASDYVWTSECAMGVDAGGEGEDTTELIIRDNTKAWEMASEKKSNPKSISNLIGTVLVTNPCKDIVIDNFGEGANVGMELAHMQIKSSPINVGQTHDVEDQFLNLRASLFWKAREWLRKGGEVSRGVAEEMAHIRYRKTLSGKIQIMSKLDMKKIGIPSPNKADAFMLTFYVDLQEKIRRVQKYNPLDDSDRKRKSRSVYE